MPAASMTPAIVLRSWSFGESDKIVSFLTQTHGKITGIAKGAKRSRKRFVNSLEPFALVNLHFHERTTSSLAFIHACELVRVFKRLTVSLENIAHASYLMEITDALAGERDENTALFTHLRDGLDCIEENGVSELLLAFFELKLLMLTGYQPMLEHCRRCARTWPGSSGGWCFSLRDGGILCQSCSSLRREVSSLSLETVKLLAELQRSDRFIPSHAPAGALREGHLALLRFIQYQTGKELKSAPFLDVFSTG